MSISRSPSPSAGAGHAAALSFGTDTERYDRTRPRYPQPLIDWILASLPSTSAASPGRELLDVGSGTGVAARQL